MTVTRVALCSVKGCPAPSDPDWHQPHCGHGTAGQHQHWPKRSQGGKEIVAFLCHDCHDKVDNRALLKNEVCTRTFVNKTYRFYRLWKPGDEHKPDGWALVWKEIPDGNGRREEEAGVAGVPGTLPDTGLPEGPGREELSPPVPTFETVRINAHATVVDWAPPPPPTNLAPDFGPDYLELPSEFTLQDAVPWAAMVGKWEHGRQWYAGDLLLACEARFGHERLWGHSVSPDGKTFVDLLGMTYPSLRNCQRVCEAFSPGERYPLSFGHHAACYTHPERDRLMAQATAEGWTVSKLREAVSGHTEPETHSCPLCGAEHRVKAQ